MLGMAETLTQLEDAVGELWNTMGQSWGTPRIEKLHSSVC